MRIPLFLFVAFILAPLLRGEGTLTQFSTINALLAGVYDGPASIAGLKDAGDAGLGTFNALDGELIMVDGVVYQIAHDGTVRVMDDDARTPFAVACAFQPQKQFPMWVVTSFEDFDSRWRQLAINPEAVPPSPPPPLSENYFYAVRIEGRFASVRARSVPKQARPYRPLAEVVAEQNVFDFLAIDGVMIGFYCPAFAQGLNVPGWHFHFISDDRQRGGHVLDFSIEKMGDAIVAWQKLNRLDLRLPEDPAFATVDLTPNRAAELESVERGRASPPK